MSVDGDSLREVMGNFLTGVTVVTLPTDPPHGMTANAFSSVSLNPPLCLVCVDHETKTYEHLTSGADEFCVNILTANQQQLGEHFAGMHELEESPFENEPTSEAATGAPIFDECLAYLDCTVDVAHEAGDHTIYVGVIEATDVNQPGADPLGFFQGRWISSVD